MKKIYSNHEYYMKMALREAKKAYKLGEVPIGCVIVYEDKIIGRGYNRRNTDKSTLAHAEITAIKKASKVIGDWRLEECTLYVTLEPCVMCAGAIGWAQVKRLVYGAGDEKRGYSHFAPQALHPRTEVVSGIMSDEAVKLMTDFFKSKR